MFLAERRNLRAKFVIIARVNSTNGLEANVCARLVAAILPHGGVGESRHDVLCGLAEHSVYRALNISKERVRRGLPHLRVAQHLAARHLLQVEQENLRIDWDT